MHPTFATEALENGGAIDDLADHLGQARVDTTRTYGQRGYNPERTPGMSPLTGVCGQEHQGGFP